MANFKAIQSYKMLAYRGKLEELEVILFQLPQNTFDDVLQKGVLLELCKHGYGNDLLQKCLQKTTINYKELVTMDQCTKASLLYFVSCAGYEKIVQTLLKAQCDPNFHPQESCIPLFGADNNAVVALLLDAKADTSQKNQSGETVFELAVKNNCTRLKMLGEHSDLKNMPFLLHTCCENFYHLDRDFLSTICVLLKAGCDPWVKNKENKNCKDLMQDYKYDPIYDKIVFLFKHVTFIKDLMNDPEIRAIF